MLAVDAVDLSCLMGEVEHPRRDVRIRLLLPPSTSTVLAGGIPPSEHHGLFRSLETCAIWGLALPVPLFSVIHSTGFAPQPFFSRFCRRAD